MADNIISLGLPEWNIEAMCGYVPKTTFYMDFSIADRFGPGAVKETYKRAFEQWKTNVVFITELVMVLNWKIWEHYEHNDGLAKLYNDLWETAGGWCLDNLKDDDLRYYLETTD